MVRSVSELVLVPFQPCHWLDTLSPRSHSQTDCRARAAAPHTHIAKAEATSSAAVRHRAFHGERMSMLEA